MKRSKDWHELVSYLAYFSGGYNASSDGKCPGYFVDNKDYINGNSKGVARYFHDEIEKDAQVRLKQQIIELKAKLYDLEYAKKI